MEPAPLLRPTLLLNDQVRITEVRGSAGQSPTPVGHRGSQHGGAPARCCPDWLLQALYLFEHGRSFLSDIEAYVGYQISGTRFVDVVSAASRRPNARTRSIFGLGDEAIWALRPALGATFLKGHGHSAIHRRRDVWAASQILRWRTRPFPSCRPSTRTPVRSRRPPASYPLDLPDQPTLVS